MGNQSKQDVFVKTLSGTSPPQDVVAQ